jgi:hypothetical protein
LANLVQEYTAYYLNVSLGTPPQSFALTLDTGTSDFVVRTTESASCQAGNCTEYGSFDPTQSKTFVQSNTPYAAEYIDGSFATGFLATDTLSIGNATLSKFTIAVSNNSDIDTNIFGVGYRLDEATFSIHNTTYPNVPYAMKAAGLIEVAAYSVWLNDMQSSTGSILFGGVDTAKYTGSLQTVPVVPQAGSYNILQVSLYAIGTAVAGNSQIAGTITTLNAGSGFPITVLLDTGYTGLLLPAQIVTNICLAFGCIQQGTIYELPCRLQAPESGSISFNFSGQVITAPIGEFVRDSSALNEQYCVFDILPADSDLYILGDAFLRSAYVVYNLDANEIGLAQTVFDANTSTILEITNSTSAGSFGIPGAVPASMIQPGAPSGTGSLGPATTSIASKKSSIGGAVVLVFVAIGALLL